MSKWWQMKKWQMIKQKCLDQNKHFLFWDSNRTYRMFHHSHYDWWAFPIDQPSSYGDKYQVGPEEKQALIRDQQFINALRSNSILVCRSWGYNLQKGEEYKIREDTQTWQNWPIRLHKMTTSLELFEQKDLFINAVRYGNLLIYQGHNFSYGSKRLDQYFLSHLNNIDQARP